MDKPFYSVGFSRLRLAYRFTSKGRNGEVLKAVVMQHMQMPDAPQRYNLAMADVIDGKMRFDHITDNQDHDLLAGTLYRIVIDFMTRFPGAEVFLTGNTPAKTRLYQMQIAKNLDYFDDGVVVFGYKSEGGPYEQFKKGENYVAFWVARF